MKKLLLILAPILVVWALLVGGLVWYFLRDHTAPLTRPPADGITFELEINPFSLVGHSNGLAGLKQAYVRRFAKLGFQFYWQELSATRVQVITPRVTPDQLTAITNALVHRGQLEFRLVHPDGERLVQEGQVAPGYFIVTKEPGDGAFRQRRETLLVAVQVEPGLQPDPIHSAMVVRGQLDEPQISFQLTPRAATAFAKLAGENVGRRLAIIVDGELLSAPSIQTAIGGGYGVISGSMNPSQAMELASRLESPLPAQVTLVEDRKR